MDKKNLVPVAEIKEIQTDIKGLVDVASSLEIKTAEDADKATDLLSKIKKAFKGVEDKRLTFTRPLNESLSAINKEFKDATAPLLTSENIIKNKILSWRREENERIRKEEERRRKIQEAHAEKGHEVKAPVEIRRVENTVGKSQVRKIKKWELTDFGALPTQYKTVDTVALNEAVRSGVAEIPGVRIYEEEILAIRSN